MSKPRTGETGGGKQKLVAGATLRKCNCAHEYQDQKYGAGIRVHNLAGKKGATVAICTVCGKVN